MKENKKTREETTMEVHDSSLHISPTLPKDDIHRIAKPIDHPDGSIPPSKLETINEPREDYLLAYSKENKLKWMKGKTEVHDNRLHKSPTLPDDDIHRTSIPIDHPDYSIPIHKKCTGELTDKLHGIRGKGLHEDSHERLHDLASKEDHRGQITDEQHGIRGAGLHKDSHPRKHKLSSKEDHEGTITPEQHGDMSAIPDAHHKEYHAESHLKGGKDELPWGHGGGLDADTVDGYHASELLTGYVAGGGGRDRFIELTDTPDSYVGKGGKYPRVRSDEKGLEFSDLIFTGTPEFDSIKTKLLIMLPTTPPSNPKEGYIYYNQEEKRLMIYC